MLSTLFLGHALCIPLQSATPVETVQYKFSNLPDGGYEYNYELSDGSYKQESAKLLKTGDTEALEISGKFGFIGTDGIQYDVTYTAGEEGFIAHGDHLPRNEVLDAEKQAATTTKPASTRPPINRVLPVAVDISPAAIKSLVG